jgi:hypothetical protein
MANEVYFSDLRQAEVVPEQVFVDDRFHRQGGDVCGAGSLRFFGPALLEDKFHGSSFLLKQ